MKQQSLLKKINEQIVIQITTLLFLQAISTVFGDCTNATTGQNFNSAEYICALASYQISSFNNTNPNLKFPSNDCKNIQQITENGNSYYGTGGNNCDYTQPIILNFDSSPYYANRVYLFPVQWVYQSNSNCAALDISISVNNLAPKSYKLNPSKYLTQGICDYYTERFTYDNINQIVTSVSYTPGSKSKFIEQLYIIIFKGAYCISCSQGCKTCFGISQNQCLHCMETYQLFNKQCFQQYFNYNSSLKNETMYNIVQLIHDSSQITFLSSLLLSFINNLVSTSTFAFLMSGFVGQKFSFFLLLDVILPKYLYEILLALQKQYPTQQLRFLNVFRNWINQDITQYQSLRFEEVNISFNILQTCGQYIIIFSANMVCFLIFYYISAFAKNKKLISFSNLLYDKIFLGFMIQYCQLCLMIFVISINQQIKEFVKISEIQQIGLKLTFILILFASAGSIFYAFYKYIDYKNTKYQNINFDEITKKKLLDDIIVESNIRIHFILINLAFEAVIIPTIFIQLNEVWKAATSLSITFQLILVVITIYLRPFTTKLNNALFISNSLLWLLLYIMFLFISIFVQQPFAKNYETVLDVGIILFIVIIFILIFLPSVIMLIQLILWICDYVIKKKKQDLVKQSSNLNKIIFNKKVDIKIAKNTSYVLNRYQKEMQISNLFDELMSKRTQMVKFSKRKDLELSQLNL
ncbi:hypothetical protein ABPG73_014119 [Tetrahymena malaccensis]